MTDKYKTGWDITVCNHGKERSVHFCVDGNDKWPVLMGSILEWLCDEGVWGEDRFIVTDIPTFNNELERIAQVHTERTSKQR